MSWFTGLIAQVSPEAALRRQRARMAYEAVSRHDKRSYDGASKGRRVKNWNPGGTSATAENRAAAGTLRNRSRDLVRNDAYASRGVSIISECAVGSGIVPEPATGTDALDRAIKDAFEEWTESCDAEEMLDFYGLQDLACETIVLSGDVLVRRRRRRNSDGLRVPLQLQLMEPDHLDFAQMKNGGNDIVAGIELDRLNRRQAYWLYPDHPGDTTILRATRLASSRVPADQIAHAFRKTRPGQLIGVPWLAPVMIDLRDLHDYEGAEQVRKKIEACFSAFRVKPDGADEREIGDDEEDETIESMEPGIIETLPPGEDIRFAQPTAAPGYGEYTRSRLHKIATGLNMPYMLLTGDVSQANWSSYKAGIVPFKGMIRRFQKRTLLPMACRPMWRWFIESAYAAGRIPEIDYSVSWTLPGFEPIDRHKELMADQIEARIGKASMKEIIKRDGGNPERVLKAFADWYGETDEQEFVFDSDPRKVSNAGLTQARPPGTVIPNPNIDDGTSSEE